MARLSPVPARPRRMLGVVRVSKERDGMVSPELQVTAITDHCARTGSVLVDIVEGLDESGSQRRSKWWATLDRAVAAVEAGEYDGIVVWKFSRTARHRLKWAVALDRVEVAGGVIESATEQFDTTTSAGRFARGMIAEMNAFEAERIGEVWKESHERRVRSGRPHTGKPRFGYVYDPATKLHVPHEEQAPILADLYRRYVAGESFYLLVVWLNGRGWRTPAGQPWSDMGLRRQLDNGFASGRFRYHGELHDGVHEAIIDDDLWQAYQDARVLRRMVPPRVERSPYLLSGLVRCARCGSMMVAYREEAYVKRDGRRDRSYPSKGVRLSWRCKRCRELGQGTGGYVASWKVEEVVMDHLRGLADEVDEALAARPVVESRRVLLEVEAERLAREANRLQEALGRLAMSHAENPLPGTVYANSKRDLEERYATVAAALEVASAESRHSSARPAQAAANLLASWETLPVAGRRQVLRSLIDCVLVRTGQEPFLRLVPWTDARS